MICWTTKNVQKGFQAKKPIFLGQESEKSENQVPKFEECQKNGTCAP